MDNAQNAAPDTTTNAATTATEAQTHAEVASSDLQLQLDAALSQLKEAQEAFLRAKAEGENIRRRAQEDIAKAHKFALEGFAESLLPVREALELALVDTSADATKVREGVEATLRLLTASFDKQNVLQLNPSAGEKFDPNMHQSVGMMPNDAPNGTVAQVLQKGYSLNGRILRPALVMLSSGAAA